MTIERSDGVFINFPVARDVLVGGLVVLGNGGIKPAKKGFIWGNYDIFKDFVGCAGNSAKKGEICRTLIWNEPIYDH